MAKVWLWLAAQWITNSSHGNLIKTLRECQQTLSVTTARLLANSDGKRFSRTNRPLI